MKKLLFLIALLSIGLTNNVLKAQTNVSGVISSNTSWTLSNSPYIVTGNILVNNGVTLTIEPGVTVKFDPLKALQINGQFIAKGTDIHYITFTSSNSTPSAGDWGYMFFNELSTDAVFDILGNYTEGTIMEYCIVEYAGSGDNILGAVQMTSSHPFINYCIIRNNNKSGIYANNLTSSLKITNSTIYNNTRYCSDGDGGGGIFASGGIVTISNNTLSDNSSTYRGDGGGIFVKDCTPIITNNTIINNSASYNGGALYVVSGAGTIITNNIISGNTASMEYGGIYTLFGTATISDNIIYNNGGGIMIYYGGASITNNIISGNTAPYAGGGVYIRSAAATISNNVISNNSVSYNEFSDLGGGGISLDSYYSGMSVTITKNSIVGNTAVNESAVDYNISYVGLYDENFTYNTIVGNKSTNSDNTSTIRMSYLPPIHFNNIFNNVATYELYNTNGNSSTLDAINNWWGTTDDATIQGKIYDWMDDASIGIVNYSPYLTVPDTTAPISPPTNVVKKDLGSGQVEITWLPNPESDIAGYNVSYGGFNGFSFTNVIDVGNITSYTLSGVSFTDTIGVTAYDYTYSHTNDYDSTIVNDNMTNGNESWFAISADSSISALTENNIEIPKAYALYQNYPNPFNPSTNISWQSPVGGRQTIKVYDVLGNEIETLFDEFKPAGSYTTQWNAANKTSGVYFYRLQSGAFTETKKLILLK